MILTLACGVAGAVVRAAGAKKFYEQQRALRAELRTAQESEGLAGRENQKALYAKYPTPEITLCKPVIVAPGGSATVSLGGKFVPKTTFLVANDDVEISDGLMATGKYTAKVTAAPNARAAFAPIHAIAPVSGANDSCGAVLVGAVASYELKADNGWTIKVTPVDKAFRIKPIIGVDEAELRYQVEFFKPGETAAFKKKGATLTLRSNESPDKDVYLSLGAVPDANSPEAELEAIQKTMSDPKAYMKLSEKEQERLMTRMGQLLEQQLKAMTAADATQKSQAEQDNGCSALMFNLNGTTATGSATCGRNVSPRGSIKLTGTMTVAPVS